MSIAKRFKDSCLESTCQKRIVVCEIYDEKDNLLASESNRCNPDGGICSRLGMYQSQESYDVHSTCNWTHAEINAINALQEGSKPNIAVLYGHDFICNPCKEALQKAGVAEFHVIPSDLRKKAEFIKKVD